MRDVVTWCIVCLVISTGKMGWQNLCVGLIWWMFWALSMHICGYPPPPPPVEIGLHFKPYVKALWSCHPWILIQGMLLRMWWVGLCSPLAAVRENVQTSKSKCTCSCLTLVEIYPNDRGVDSRKMKKKKKTRKFEPSSSFWVKIA